MVVYFPCEIICCPVAKNQGEWSSQGLFYILKAAPSRDKKGHFFPTKDYEREPVISATPMFTAYLQCPDKTNF